MDDDYVLAKQQVIKSMNGNSLILFVGAGISVNSGLPSWKTLIDSFGEELHISNEENNTKDYLRIAQYYYDTFGQNHYIKKIEEIFSKGKVPLPNELHRLIGKIRPKHIITTNYDTLLEQQFEQEILKYNIVAEDKDIPYTNSENYLLKMHGDLNKKNFVLKEDDYLDYHLNFPMLTTLIQSLIMNNTLLFVGYSLEDSTFNSIFRLIQNSFLNDAKLAYFYSVSKPSKIVRDYYKKKGIYIISNENDELRKKAEEVDLEPKYYLTLEFFNEILEKKNDNVVNSKILWDKISFLDKMNFVEVKDIHKFSGLSSRAISIDNNYFWYKDSESNFDITNKELINFVKEKTLLDSFFNINLAKERQYKENELLAKPYILYKEKKYTLAKMKFRELANLTFQRKDYINFLICEFNFNHIHTSWPSEEDDYPSPIMSIELEQLTQQLVDSLSGDEKMIIEYFRDNILNMHFLYSKLEDINNYFDKIREENRNYKAGGRSYNNNLNNAGVIIRNLQQFLDLNCICVEQYSIYKSIINRYFEILLLSYDNSYSTPKNSIFSNETTSSILKEIDLEDIKIILPNIDKKQIKYYLSNYSLSRIKISNDAKDYIYNRFDTLQKMNFSMLDENFHEYRRILSLLSVINYDDLTGLIDVLGKINVNYELSSELKGILKTIIKYSDLLTEENKISLEEILTNQISIIEENKHSTFYSLYDLYKKILEICTSDIYNEIKIDKLEIQLLKIKCKKIEPYNIFDFQSLFLNFFYYLSEETQNLVLEILSTFTEENVSSKYYNNIIEIMNNKIFEFPNLRHSIYNYLISEINRKDKISGVKVFPDPWEISISQLFNLWRKGYFDENEILSDIEVEIEGVFPEVDWVWFKNHSDEVMEKFLEDRDIANIKEHFATTIEEKQEIDRYVIKTYDKKRIMKN